MTESLKWGNCARCAARVEAFGTMGHIFVDAELQTICLDCAQQLVPDAVRQAEAAEEMWSRDSDVSAGPKGP